MNVCKGILLLVVLGLVGCSTPYKAVTKTAKVLWDPDIPVGKPEDLPSKMDITMLAEPDVNPNEAMQSSPIKFQVIELEDDSGVMAADFDQFLKNMKETLGENYIDHSDYALLPRGFKFIEPFEISEDTRYIGVMAFYSYPNQSQWKKVIKVDPVGGHYHLLVNLREREVILKKADD